MSLMYEIEGPFRGAEIINRNECCFVSAMVVK
jgi:hypothetical protein